MATRDLDLEAFIQAAKQAFSASALGEPSRQSVERIFKALSQPQQAGNNEPCRAPACEHLDAVCNPKSFEAPLLHKLATRFMAIEPKLSWRARSTVGIKTTADFKGALANVMIAGPNGLEHRQDVWLGASLIAPESIYPDHQHKPEETYLVMSSGLFRQEAGDWFEPGIGGSFYNRPNIVHAMQATTSPLFAFWALWIEHESA